MKKKILSVVLLLISGTSFALEEVTTNVKSVMVIEGGGVLIYTTENIHTCSHPDRIGVRTTDNDFNKHVLSVAIAAKTTGTKVKMFMKDGCLTWNQKELHAIIFGEHGYW